MKILINPIDIALSIAILQAELIIILQLNNNDNNICQYSDNVFR